MKSKLLSYISFLALAASATSCCCRHVRVAHDITPGNLGCEKLDWRYGAGDIRIQTFKILSTLMDRWIVKTNYDVACGKPTIVITAVDNAQTGISLLI